MFKKFCCRLEILQRQCQPRKCHHKRNRLKCSFQYCKCLIISCQDRQRSIMTFPSNCSHSAEVPSTRCSAAYKTYIQSVVCSLFQVKSVKPSLKQLQQSIQTITASHSEDGRKTMHFSFAKLASALLYVILCIVSHIMLGCVLFRATVPQSKSCRSVSVVAQGIYVCACLFGKTFRFVRFYSLTDAVPNIQHGSP